MSSTSEPLLGFMFVCSNKTQDACFEHSVLALPRAHFEALEAIKPTTEIFLFNFISKRVYGVFQADGPAGVNLVENLWPELAPKTYPAQIRFKRTASDKSALRPAGVTMPQAGPMHMADVVRVRKILGLAPPPVPGGRARAPRMLPGTASPAPPRPPAGSWALAAAATPRVVAAVRGAPPAPASAPAPAPAPAASLVRATVPPLAPAPAAGAKEEEQGRGGTGGVSAPPTLDRAAHSAEGAVAETAKVGPASGGGAAVTAEASAAVAATGRAPTVPPTAQPPVAPLPAVGATGAATGAGVAMGAAEAAAAAAAAAASAATAAAAPEGAGGRQLGPAAAYPPTVVRERSAAAIAAPFVRQYYAMLATDRGA